jgi:hypothetical protein
MLEMNWSRVHLTTLCRTSKDIHNCAVAVSDESKNMPINLGPIGKATNPCSTRLIWPEEDLFLETSEMIGGMDAPAHVRELGRSGKSEDRLHACKGG